jgi:aminoglycoside phosphotransferase (APT) family kinase protein
MDRSPGAPLLGGLGGVRSLASIPRLARRLPRLLASTALQLHLLDPAPLVAALHREVPDAAVDTSDHLARLRSAAETFADPALLAATEWLARTQPAAERTSICHGDLHPLNLLSDAQGNVTLIDWTASRIAEPAYDLGFTLLVLRHAPLDVPARLAPAVRRAARWLAARTLATYRELAAPHGIAADDARLAWYTALHATRVLTEVELLRAEARSGHPFMGMAPAVRAELAAITSG